MTVITKLTDENKNTIKNGVIYMRLSNNFTDSINVYDGNNPEIKYGVINFVKKGKPVYNPKYRVVTRNVDGFVFEPEPLVEIQCSTFKHIARYVYDLNEQFKEYGRLKGENNSE